MDKIKNIKLTIDSRETKLLNHFEQYDFVKKETLDLGDLIIFQNETPLLIIERKTISDLAASIIDGRYREQKQRLKKSNCNFCYLIEGSYRHKFKSTIIGALLNLNFRDEIPIIKADNISDSIYFIEKLIKKYEKNDFEIKDINVVNYRIKKKDCYEQKDCFKLQLNLIPGVSLNMATKLVQHFDSMQFLIKYLKENGDLSLQDISYDTDKKLRKIGEKNSKIIYTYLMQ